MTTDRRLPLFVYGTLRRGEMNHHCLAGRYSRCQPATLHGFMRGRATHGFPTVVRAAGVRVDGELFDLLDEHYETVLRECDRLEDLEPGTLAGAYYRRLAVHVMTAEGEITAWVYADAGVAG